MNLVCLANYSKIGILTYNGFTVDKDDYIDVTEMLAINNYGDTYDSPTISQVLKWLREEKKILVVAAPAFLYREARYFWQCGIYEISLLPNVIPFHKFIDNQENYESAILAGIEYCLDNLI